ncbi:MAG: transglutaminase-like domain-containing protein [Patescibacteria group bacterium]
MYIKEDIAKPSLKNEAPGIEASSLNVDQDSIIKQKDTLFSSLEASQGELNRDELLELTARVFENSVKDGLSLATKLRLTPSEIAGIISSPSFILKNSELARDIIISVHARNNEIKDQDLAVKLFKNIAKIDSCLNSTPETGEQMIKQLLVFDTRKLKSGSSSQLKKLVSSVDNYYEQYISKKEVENIDQKVDFRTKGEKLAEDSLGRILPAMEGKYLAGEVLNTLYEYVKNDDPKVINQISNSESNPKDIVLDYLKREGWPQEDINQLKYESLISKELIDNFKTVFKFDKLTERKFSAGRYKPLDLVYDAGKNLAKENLIKEIERLIKSRSREDIRVVFNKETKEYEAKEVKQEDENLKKEGIETDNEKLTSEIKEIDIGKYQILFKFYKVGDKIAFTTEGADKNGITEKYIVTEDGKEIGRGKGYRNVYDLQSINNQIVFKVEKDHGKYFVVTEDGRELGKGYGDVHDLQSINNQIFFRALENGRYLVVTEDGRELGGEYNVHDLQNINNQIVFKAKKDDGKYFVVTEDGRELGKGYEKIDELQNINNKIVFVARKDFKEFIVTEDGRKHGKEYSYISKLTSINSQIVFMAEKGDGKYFIVTEDGRELGKEYDNVIELTSINNQIVYIARKNNEWFVVTEDGRELGGECDGVSQVASINNQIVFTVRKNNKWFVVTEDGRELGKEYDNVSRLTSIKDQIVFKAEKDGKEFIVTEDGRELGREYDNIEIFLGENEVTITGIKEEEDETGKISWKLFKETIGPGKKEIKENNFELSKIEKNKLELLNLVNNPEKDKINDYLLNKSKQKEENNKTAWQKLKSGVENSRATINGLNKIISKIPEEFLNTVKAQSGRNQNILRDQLLMKIFPEIYKSESNNWLGGFSFFGGSGSREKNNNNNQYEDPSSYLNAELNGLNGGDPSPEQGEEKEVMILRDKLNDFISFNILGQGLDNPSSSLKSYFSLNHKSEGPFTETTITLPNIGNLNTIRLPKPVTSNVILERVKGVTKNNEEILLETEINSLGEVNVLPGKNKVEKVVYSLQISQDPLDRIIPKISDKEYDKYQERFIKENGQDLKENIADLPEELEFFANSLKSLPPKERIVAIEQFVKQYGYYDFKNGEINKLKNGKSASEQVLMMEMRMEQLKEANPELKNKKYAGVCSDFALLNTALLRKAGILSGVAAGFGSNEKNIYPSMAHAVSYVVLPDNHNLNQVFMVDPTPTGVNEEEEKLLAEFREPSISEKESQAEDEINKEKLDALKSLEEIEKTIGLNNLEELKKLTNGKLEDALNTILKYEVKGDNLKVVSNLLSSYWYSPLNKLDFNNTDDQAYFKDTFKKEINRVKSEIEASPELKERPSGSELFNLIKDFKDRFTKNSNDSGLDLIDKIVDLNKDELSNTELQALTVISNYLRAKNMLG